MYDTNDDGNIYLRVIAVIVSFCLEIISIFQVVDQNLQFGI